MQHYTPAEKKAWIDSGQRKGTRRYVKRMQCAALWKMSGEQCRQYAEKDRLYCKGHGNHKKGKFTHEESVRGGRANWARLSEAAKNELRSKGGLKTAENKRRKKAGLPLLPTQKDKQRDAPKGDQKLFIRAANMLTTVRENLPPVPDKPWEELALDEKLVTLTGMSLDRLKEIVQIPISSGDGEYNLKAATLVKDTAHRTISTLVKVEANMMKAKRADRVLDVLERLRAEQDRIQAAKTIEGVAKQVG